MLTNTFPKEHNHILQSLFDLFETKIDINSIVDLKANQSLGIYIKYNNDSIEISFQDPKPVVKLKPMMFMGAERQIDKITIVKDKHVIVGIKGFIDLCLEIEK